MLLHPSRTYNNLFDAHPPFQIDGNFGGAAGILEMLVQSDDEEIILLPALPSQWSAGVLRGVRVRGGVTLAFSWSDGRPTSIEVTSNRPYIGRVRWKDHILIEHISAGTVRLDRLNPGWPTHVSPVSTG